MKQTAVDWLFNQMNVFGFSDIQTSVTATKEVWEEIYKEAKEMEKEQIVNAHGHQSNVRITAQGNTLLYLKDGEEYYKETYE